MYSHNRRTTKLSISTASTSSNNRQHHATASIEKKSNPFDSYRHQEWSLPDPIIEYIAMNPSSPKIPICVVSFNLADYKMGSFIRQTANLSITSALPWNNQADEVKKKSNPFDSNRLQKWSLPEKIIEYIAKNPSSPKVYQNLVKSCKYFFIKNPILVIDDLKFKYVWKTWYNGKRAIIDKKMLPNKIWFTGGLDIDDNDMDEDAYYALRNIFKQFLPKIYRCDFTDIYICDQDITYDQFIIMAANVKRFHGQNLRVFEKDGHIVDLEDIVKNLTALRWLTWGDSRGDINVSELFLKIPHFLTLDSLDLYDVPDAFDLETFYTYMKKNKVTAICLRFSRTISAEYKRRLDEIIAEILETKSHDYKPPHISYNGLAKEKIKKLDEMRRYY